MRDKVIVDSGGFDFTVQNHDLNSGMTRMGGGNECVEFQPLLRQGSCEGNVQEN